MGVTDVKDITTVGVRNFNSAVKQEDHARDHWMGRWGWMLDLYREISDELMKLKIRKGHKIKRRKIYEDRDILPFPVTTSGEYGWLASKADFHLEIFGRMPNTRKPPLELPNLAEELRKLVEKQPKKFLF